VKNLSFTHFEDHIHFLLAKGCFFYKNLRYAFPFHKSPVLLLVHVNILLVDDILFEWVIYQIPFCLNEMESNYLFPDEST